MNFQPLFADSLTSTLLDWLGYATGLPVLARQLVLPVIDGVSLLVEQIHDKFSQIFFEAILVRTSLISEKLSC